MNPADTAAFISAAIALWAAWYSHRQFTYTVASGREDDARKRKRVAIEMAQEWCRTEAPSPVSILREWLRSLRRPEVEVLLAGNALTVPAVYADEVATFFAEALPGANGLRRIVPAPDGTTPLTENNCQIVRNYFARRLNFLEVVAGAHNSGLADAELIEQFFGGIIDRNGSYKTATELQPSAWPQLARFYARPGARGAH